MINAVLRYEVLNSGAALCVLDLDTNQGDEVTLRTAPLHLTMGGQFINLDAGTTGSDAPSPTTESLVYDPQQQRHVWRGEVANHRMLTIGVKRESAFLGWAGARFEQGQFFVSVALQLGIDLQVAPLSCSALAERSHPGTAGPTSEGDDWRRVVRAYARERRVEEVLALFTQRAGRYAAGMTQGDVETFRHIGFFLALQGHLAQSLSAFNLVLRELPTKIDVILARGIVLQEMGQHAAATRAFRAALALDADCSVAWELLGDALLFAFGDPPAALVAYERATVLNPVRASSYHGKGTALSRCGRISEALAAFETAVWLDPYEPRYRESLRALQAESPPFEPLGQGPAWDQFTEHSRLFCEWLTAFMDELIAQRGGPAIRGYPLLCIPLDTPEASQQLAGARGRLEGATGLARAFLELWSSRRARLRHSLHALRYWWGESQVRRQQSNGRKAVLVSLVLLHRLRRRLLVASQQKTRKGESYGGGTTGEC